MAETTLPGTNVELSVVIPCLNEDDTIAECLAKAFDAFRKHGIQGEVIVADNGSTDDSVAIATRMGARVVAVAEKGYGNALMGGITAARGRFIIMGDADASYDFADIPAFLKKLRGGYDLVQGCRLPGGGGKVMPGAMPRLHEWIGNPFFSLLGRWWFHVPVHDVYCGLRGFRKTLYDRLDQRCTGMEFATEMIIKASLYKARITEVPIVLHKDGRRSRRPHLKTFHDGWRTLRFFLISSPRWLFYVPGMLMIILGVIGYILVIGNLSFRGIRFDAHTLLFASLAVIMGYQSVLFAAFTKIFAISDHLLPPDPRLKRLFTMITLEKSLAIASVVFLAGAAMLIFAVNYWRLHRFGPLEYRQTMRWVIPGMTLAALGFQTLLSSFFISILGMRRK